MNTTAEKLLADMKVRLDMQQKGITNPGDQVKKATIDLVEKLSKMKPDEEIRAVCGEGSLVRYERFQTGEVLAEIFEK